MINAKLLETSFDKVRSKTAEFSASFYQKLFTYHPELKPLFADADLAAQEKKLIASLAIIVENLRNPGELTMALKSLGAYHVEVGTMKEHYPMVGQVLIETFADYLGSDWNCHAQQAWLDAYDLITNIMLEGAQNPTSYLGGELTFYEWLDLYGESSPEIQKAIALSTNFQYRNYKA